MKVTLFGLGGSGKSTAGSLIAEKLGLEFISSGKMFREMAKKRQLTTEQLDEQSLFDDGATDKLLDDEIARIGRESDNFLVESRLAWHFVPDSIKIYFKCENTVRYARIARREGISLEQAAKNTVMRDASIIDRAWKYYGLKDFWFDRNFDVVIPTTTASIEDITRIAVENIRHHNGFRTGRPQDARAIPAAAMS